MAEMEISASQANPFEKLSLSRILQARYPHSLRVLKLAGYATIGSFKNEFRVNYTSLQPEESLLRNAEKFIDFSVGKGKEGNKPAVSASIADERRWQAGGGLSYIKVERFSSTGDPFDDSSFKVTEGLTVETGRFLGLGDSLDFFDTPEVQRDKLKKAKETIRFLFRGNGKTSVALSYNPKDGLRYHPSQGTDFDKTVHDVPRWSRALGEQEAAQAAEVLRQDYGIDSRIFSGPIDMEATAAAVLADKSEKVFDAKMVRYKEPLGKIKKLLQSRKAK